MDFYGLGKVQQDRVAQRVEQHPLHDAEDEVVPGNGRNA